MIVGEKEGGLRRVEKVAVKASYRCMVVQETVVKNRGVATRSDRP